MRTEPLANYCGLARPSPSGPGSKVLPWSPLSRRGWGLLLGPLVAVQPVTAQMTSQEFQL